MPKVYRINRDIRARGDELSTLDSVWWRALAWFGVGLQAFALFAVLWLQRWGGAWTICTFLVLCLAFLLAKERIPSLMSLFVVLAAILNAGGWVWDWFHKIAFFDEFVHLFTAFAAVSALMYRMRLAPPEAPGESMSVTPLIGAAAVIGLVLGIAWEAVEAAFLDLTWSDTFTDVLIDTLGAGLGGWFALWALRKRAG